jgi:ADP-ribose pyrophosphatase YjhB (NUDIX family)
MRPSASTHSYRTTGLEVVADADGVLRPLVGVGGIVWHGDRVLLIRRAKPPRVGQWSLPGGRQEWGETVEAALRREVLEETSLVIGALLLVAVVDLVERDEAGRVHRHFTLIDYTAEAATDAAVAGSDAAAVGWFRPGQLPDLGLWSETVNVIERAAALRSQP